MTRKLQGYQTTVLNQRMWHFMGVKTYWLLIHIFGGQDLKPAWSMPPSLSLSRFNGHFPGEAGLASAYWSKGWWRWWWQLELQVVQSSSQIITTNKPTKPWFQSLLPNWNFGLLAGLDTGVMTCDFYYNSNMFYLTSESINIVVYVHVYMESKWMS